MKANQLLNWIRRDLNAYSGDEHIQVIESTDQILKIAIYTDVNKYSIKAVVNDDGGYLGCQGSSRKPRAGEDWCRGNDLADGPYNEQTWNDIKDDILSFELVIVHRKKK